MGFPGVTGNTATAPASKRLFRQRQMMTWFKQKYLILAQNVNTKHSDICKSILFRNYLFQFEMKTNMKIPEFPMGRKFSFSMSGRKYIHWEVVSLLQSHCFLWLCLNANKKTLRTCLKAGWPPGFLSAHGDATRSWPPVPEYPSEDNFFVMPDWNFPWCNLWLLPLILLSVPPRTGSVPSVTTLKPACGSPLSFLWPNKPRGPRLCVPTLQAPDVGSRSPKLYTDLHIHSIRGTGDKGLVFELAPCTSFPRQHSLGCDGFDGIF